MKLFALLAVAVSLVLVGCQQSSTDSTTSTGKTNAPATTNAPAAPATK